MPAEENDPESEESEIEEQGGRDAAAKRERDIKILEAINQALSSATENTAKRHMRKDEIMELKMANIVAENADRADALLRQVRDTACRLVVRSREWDAIDSEVTQYWCGRFGVERRLDSVGCLKRTPGYRIWRLDEIKAASGPMNGEDWTPSELQSLAGSTVADVELRKKLHAGLSRLPPERKQLKCHYTRADLIAWGLHDDDVDEVRRHLLPRRHGDTIRICQPEKSSSGRPWQNEVATFDAWCSRTQQSSLRFQVKSRGRKHVVLKLIPNKDNGAAGAESDPPCCLQKLTLTEDIMKSLRVTHGETWADARIVARMEAMSGEEIEYSEDEHYDFRDGATAAAPYGKAVQEISEELIQKQPL